MYQPNPLHKQVGGASVNDHYTDDLEGKGEYLYFKDFDNDIVKNNVGASKWRTIVEDKDEPGSIEPVEDTKETCFSDMLDGETDLSDIVIDNTYYNMNDDNGDGYDTSGTELHDNGRADGIHHECQWGRDESRWSAKGHLCWQRKESGCEVGIFP